MSSIRRGIISSGKLGAAAPSTVNHNALQLNGSGKYVDCGNDASLQLTGNISIGGWFSPATGSTQALVSKWNGSGNQRSVELVYSHATDKVIFYISSNGTSFVGIESSAGMGGSGLRNMIGVYDGSIMKIYVDGIEEGSLSHSSGIFDSNASVLIGAQGAGAALINGSTSLVFLSDSAYTAEDITELQTPKQPWEYSNSITNSYVLALPLNSGVASGREAEDFSGLENDGTLVGSPTYTGDALGFEDTNAVYNTFNFDAGQGALVADNATLDLTTNFSGCVWVYPKNRNVFQRIISKYSSASNARSWAFAINTNGALYWATTSTGSGVTARNTSFTVPLNEWSFVHYRIDGGNVYIGINAGSEESFSQSTIYSGVAPFEVGAVDNGGVSSDDLNITQPMLFDATLSAGQITTLYNKNLPLEYSLIPSSIKDNAVLAYAMNSNDNSLTDLSETGNDGTATGGVTSDGSEIDWERQ